jgi:hypothetical protein
MLPVNCKILDTQGIQRGKTVMDKKRAAFFRSTFVIPVIVPSVRSILS